ncbi:DUF456 domain-containing protein [Candidatus Nomurabacteria bacterium]|nr:DUF456 domain-containing protein [Candidatus Nomurabacteria bacterium]
MGIIGAIVLGIIGAVLAVAGMILTLANLPGVWLVFLSVVVAALVDRFEVIQPRLLVIFFFISLFVSLIDNILVPFGAKKMGAGKWGILGAVTGAVIGLFLGNLIGVIIGPFIGALIFELLIGKKSLDLALKAGFGTFIGFVSSVVLKFGLSVAMIAITFVKLFRG